MSGFDVYKKKFTEKEIRHVYETVIKKKATTGLDRINKETFEKNLDENIEIITRKVANGTYDFISYKEKLIMKGRDKFPRVISIPTIRDKITLNIVKGILSTEFQSVTNNELIQVKIGKLQDSIQNDGYDYFIKFDIKNFYPTINHRILLQKVRGRIKSRKILTLIKRAIQTPTKSPANTNDQNVINIKGVPQGLSISNVLADVYLNEIDNDYIGKKNLKYFRYVDDIIILCHKKDVTTIRNQINNEFKMLKLKINIEKTNSGELESGFEFLGYHIKTKHYSVKDQSLKKLKQSILTTFSEYKYSSLPNKLEILLWKLNLRITGCKFDSKKFGWLFFFSQINDESLLFKLDCFIKKLCTRYGVPKQNIKRFVRTFSEIRENVTRTKYIPNFDNYSTAEKKLILKNIFNIKVSKFTDEQIDNKFKWQIFKSVKELEKDIQNIS
ncbi:RNA-dependent DNA polymerase [Brevibacillus sp. HB1.4B]|uniref:reverse transcriptase domain-containing protein n=1 Tax=Brevibacillus sp. HB1.4B TaxID=2738845 RepID=UPI00156B7CA0|nr:reverse transcriptase domain-containing protein [Brevibacillus sp. HB1.4B]NRS15859.1 RNA-dependent DNA polymerase [Brevibacillus sp. HB1.4B]